MMVQRPSPESSTTPSKPSSLASAASALAVRSSSQEVITLPRRQTSAMSARSRSKRSSSGSASPLAFFENVEAFGIGLHQAVFDAVVDHLDEMAGAVRAGMDVAVLGARIAAVAAGRARHVARARAPARRRSDRGGRRSPCRRRSSCNSRARVPRRRRWCRHRRNGCRVPSASWRGGYRPCQNVLPPSITMSPAASSLASSPIASSVILPAGSITQTARGGRSCCTSLSRPSAPFAPSRLSAATALASWS